MPIYVYLCEQCGTRQQKRQEFDDDPLTICSVCGGRIHRVPQVVNVVYKASGFTKTDTRIERAEHED